MSPLAKSCFLGLLIFSFQAIKIQVLACSIPPPTVECNSSGCNLYNNQGVCREDHATCEADESFFPTYEAELFAPVAEGEKNNQKINAAGLVAGETRDVTYEEEFIVNSRGLKLFTSRWLPANREAKALIFLCHGYGMECSIFMKDTAMRFARAGYAVYGIDYEGHGKSDGLHGYVKSFQELTNDCAHFFKSVAEKEEYKKKARFLYGESMGGAVALLIHRQQHDYWTGAVLVAPMCKIADDVKPHPRVISILHKLSYVIPTWKIVPTKDIISLAFKDPQKREEIRANRYVYQGKPRLKTGCELLMTSIDIEKRLDEVTLPFLLLHGKDDKVTDPSVSQLLYDSAMSRDKTLKLYPDMWHGLTSAEPPQHIELVFSDIISWFDERSSAGRPDENSFIKKSNDKEERVSIRPGMDEMDEL